MEHSKSIQSADDPGAVWVTKGVHFAHCNRTINKSPTTILGPLLLSPNYRDLVIKTHNRELGTVTVPNSELSWAQNSGIRRIRRSADGHGRIGSSREPPPPDVAAPQKGDCTVPCHGDTSS
eukprot:768790-Hanusia_phi.AAC.10